MTEHDISHGCPSGAWRETTHGGDRRPRRSVGDGGRHQPGQLLAQGPLGTWRRRAQGWMGSRPQVCTAQVWALFQRCGALAAVPFVCGRLSWVIGQASGRHVGQVTTRDVGSNLQAPGDRAPRAIWRRRPWIPRTPFAASRLRRSGGGVSPGPWACGGPSSPGGKRSGQRGFRPRPRGRERQSLQRRGCRWGAGPQTPGGASVAERALSL